MDDRHPVVGIILPVYNEESLVGQAIRSVLSQTYDQWRLVVVNDGSTDGTVDVVRQFRDPRISLVNQENKKLPAALNTGTRHLDGLVKYLTWVSADSYCHEQMIEVLTRELERLDESVGLAYADYVEFGVGFEHSLPVQTPAHLTAAQLRLANQLGACFLYRASVARKIGDYDESMPGLEDWDYWYRISREYHLHKVDGAYYFYGKRADCMTERRLRTCPDFRQTFYRKHGTPADASAEERSPILSLVRKEDRKVLDVRCRRGELGAVLKARQEVEVVGVEADPDAAEEARRRLDEVLVGPLARVAADLPAEEAEEFYAERYLLRATPVEKVRRGLTSIVILTLNQLPFTQACLQSIRFRTDEPCELIVVDNGSTDGTVDYLRSQSDVRLVENSDNKGFPFGCNQGIRASRGDQILLLNNDVIVTTGWLDRLLAALHRDPKIGLVGPCTNNISGPQQVPVSYSNLHCLDGFAWQWGKTHDRLLEDAERLVGFCLLFRRSLVDELGLLDERFGLGNFEDDDYCRRARRAGYRTAIARDAFIHHFGSVTHRSEGIDHAELLARNQRLFRDKWKGTVDEERSEAEPAPSPPRKNMPRLAVRASQGDGLLLEEANVALSLCMIVRDNTSTIEAALNSIKPWVDEMIVVDTGSRDDTPELARKCGARVFHFPFVQCQFRLSCTEMS